MRGRTDPTNDALVLVFPIFCRQVQPPLTLPHCEQQATFALNPVFNGSTTAWTDGRGDLNTTYLLRNTSSPAFANDLGQNGPFQIFPTAETTMMEGSFDVATSASIVLGTLIEEKSPSYTTIHCSDRLISPSTAKYSKIDQKWRFRRDWTTKSNVTRASFGAATSGSLALQTTVEKNDSSHAAIHCLNLLTFPSAAAAKSRENAVFLREEGRAEDEEWIFWLGHYSSRSIVLEMMVEEANTLYAVIRCPNLFTSPSTAEWAENGRTRRFSGRNEKEERLVERHAQWMVCS